MIKVSIIVPIYNVDKEYFNKCIDSIVNQTLKDIEIILVDDGSTNGVDEICSHLAKKDNRIVFIQQKNQGVSVARNNAIKIANGEYIMFADSDDWLERDACEKLYKYTAPDIDIIIGRNYNFFVESNKEQESNFYGKKINEIDNKYELYKMLLIDNPKNKYAYLATPWAKLYRRTLLNSKNISFNSDVKIGEDMLFNLDSITLGNKIIIVDELIYHYRIHNNSTNYRLANEYEKTIVHTYNALEEKEKKYKLNLEKEIYYYQIRLLNNIFKYEIKLQQSITEIKRIIKDPIYKEAIEKIDIKMLEKRRKILVIFARMKFYYGIKLLYTIKK